MIAFKTKQACNPARMNQTAGLLCYSVSFHSMKVPPQSKMLPSREMVTTCQGMNLPLACSAFCAAR